MKKSPIPNLIIRIPSCIRFGNFLKFPFSVIGNFRFSRDSSLCKLSRLLFSFFTPPCGIATICSVNSLLSQGK